MRTNKGKYPGDGNGFSNSPYVNFNDGKVKFDTKWFDNANDNFGAVSGFVPKSLFAPKGILTGRFIICIPHRRTSCGITYHDLAETRGFEPLRPFRA